MCTGFPDLSQCIGVLIVMNVSFADVSIEVAEGVGFVKFLLLKTPGALGPVSVQIATQDGTATGTIFV